MSILLMASSIGMIIIALALGISTIRLANELTNESKTKSRKIWRLERKALDTQPKVIGEIAKAVSEFNNTPTRQDTTGNKPTLFLDISGHIACATLRWVKQGWSDDARLGEDDLVVASFSNFDELTEMLSVVRNIIDEYEQGCGRINHD